MSFFNPVDIINEPSSRTVLLDLVKDLETLVICSSHMKERLNSDDVLKILLNLPNIKFEHGFDSNPSLLDLSKISEKYSSEKIDLIIGLGGGSAMDTAKISTVSIPAQCKNITLSDLLEDSTLFRDFKPIDCIQVPTTAGTGSEVTPFATVWDYEHQIKKSLSHPAMFAKKAIIDSELLYDLPIEVSLSTGLDALNQGLESLWNVNANEITRPLAVKSVVTSLTSLVYLDKLKIDPSIASNLASASLLAGLSISHTRTAMCHSISYPLTLEFDLPHGLACGFTMLEVFNFNKSYIEDEIANIEQQLNGKMIIEIIDFVYNKFGFYDLVQSYIPNSQRVLKLLPQMVTPGRADNNIRRFEQADLQSIIQSSCERAQL